MGPYLFALLTQNGSSRGLGGMTGGDEDRARRCGEKDAELGCVSIGTGCLRRGEPGILRMPLPSRPLHPQTDGRAAEHLSQPPSWRAGRVIASVMVGGTSLSSDRRFNQIARHVDKEKGRAVSQHLSE